MLAKLRRYSLLFVLPALLLAACGGAATSTDEAPPPTPATDTDTTTADPGYSVSFTLTGGLEANVEGGSYFTSDYDPVVDQDLPAFNIILLPASGAAPAVGIQGIPRDISAGESYPLANRVSPTQASLYFQEEFASAEGVYALAALGELTVTAYDGETISGTVSAELAPGRTDGMFLEDTTETYDLTATFANLPVPDEASEG